MQVPPELNLVNGLNNLEEKLAPQSKIKVLDAMTMSVEKTEWLWNEMLPVGELTVMAGESGIGKTQQLINLTATVTRGGYFPASTDPVQQGKVVYLSAEDSWEKTLLPRFIACGGQRENLVPWDRSGTDGDLLNLRVDLPEFEDALSRIDNLKLFIIDPALAFVGDGFDNDNAVGVRRVLTQLQEIAHHLDIAIIAMCHLTKDENRRMSSRILGSGSWVHLPRMVWGVIDHPENGLMLGKMNCNIAPLGGIYRYELVEREVQGKFIYCADWLEEEQEVWRFRKLNDYANSGGHIPSMGDQVKDALKVELDGGDWCKASVIIDRLREQYSCSAQTVQRACNELKADRSRSNEQNGYAMWRLPSSTA
jgi:hypothetical protein